METVITSDMPVSLSFHRSQTDPRYDAADKVSYIGMFQPKHHVYLPSTRYNPDGSPYSFQVHDGIEILYITDGQGVLHFADEDVPMQRGDICLINPYELHNFTFDRHCCERLCIVFFPRGVLTGVRNLLPDAAEALLTASMRLQRHIPGAHPAQSALAQCLCGILHACQRETPCAKLELHGALLNLIVVLLNHELYTPEHAGTPFIPTMLQKTLQYLDQHLHTNIRSADAARHLGYTHAYFCRMFRKYFGTTFTAYVNDRRIAEAQQRLMQHPGLPITELSQQLGFHDANYFSCLFRKRVGVSPSDFAKKYKGGSSIRV